MVRGSRWRRLSGGHNHPASNSKHDPMEVEHRYGNGDGHGIKPVKKPTMSGQESPGIFLVGGTLEQALNKIAALSGDGNAGGKHDNVRPCYRSKIPCMVYKPIGASNEKGASNAPECPCPGLVGRDRWSKFATPKLFTGKVRTDIGGPHSDDHPCRERKCCDGGANQRIT